MKTKMDESLCMFNRGGKLKQSTQTNASLNMGHQRQYPRITLITSRFQFHEFRYI